MKQWLVLLGLALILFGCGGDEDIIEDVIEDIPGSSDWVGTWEMFSSDGETFEELFNTDDDDVETSISQNDLVFADNGLWFLVFAIKFVADLGDGVFLSFEMVFKISGTYLVEESKYTMIMQSIDVEIIPKQIAGVDTVELREEIEKGFETGFDVESGTWILKGNQLILTEGDGSVFVLRKK